MVRLRRCVRGSAGRTELVSAVVLCGVVLAGAAGLLASRSLAGALWCATSAILLAAAGRYLLAKGGADPADAMRQRLRTRWLERALEGSAHGDGPALLQRRRQLCERIDAPGNGPRLAPGRQVRAIWAIAAAIGLLGAGIGSLVVGAAERRKDAAAAELDREDPAGWVAVQAANDAELVARDVSGRLVTISFGLAAGIAAVALAQVILGSELARRRMLRGACPECGYDLAGAPDAVDPALVGASCGPERCPECASPWPAVAPATDAEVVARARR